MERIIVSFKDDTSIYAKLSGIEPIKATLTEADDTIAGVVISQITSEIHAHLSDVESINAILTEKEGTIEGEVSRYSDYKIYEGDYIVTPKANEEVVLETSDKLLTDDVTVLEIPYYKTSNVSGYTVYIG